MNKVLIVGVGRSGTSLLQSMLNAHSKVCFLPETQFLRNYVFKKKFTRLDQKSRDELLRNLRLDKKIGRLKLKPEVIVDEYSSIGIIYEKILARFAETKGKTIVGDKDPRILDYLLEIRKLNFSPKIIHLIRDPRSVVASRLKANWSKKWPFFMHVLLYNAQLEWGRTNGRSLFGKNYHELYYEDLIKSPKQELEIICNFINVDYEPSMLSFQESAKQLVNEEEYQWKKETTGPLLSGNNTKWRNELNADQIYLTEKLCLKIFEKHPFETSKNLKVSIITKLKGLVLIPVSILFSLLYPLRKRF